MVARCFTQGIGSGERGEEDRVLRARHRGAGLGAGRADKPEQDISAVCEQLARIGRGPGGIVAIIELAKLQRPAWRILASVEGVHVQLGAGREGQADLAGSAGQRHRLTKDDLAPRRSLAPGDASGSHGQRHAGLKEGSASRHQHGCFLTPKRPVGKMRDDTRDPAVRQRVGMADLLSGHACSAWRAPGDVASRRRVQPRWRRRSKPCMRRWNSRSQTPWPSLRPRFSNFVNGR